MDQTTITIDRETYGRLRTIAGDTPLMRYLRELTLGKPSAIDAVVEAGERTRLINEIRDLDTKLGIYAKHKDDLEVMFSRADIRTLKLYKRQSEAALANPEEHGAQYYERLAFADFAARLGVSPKVLESLVKKLAKLTPESFQQVIKWAEELK